VDKKSKETALPPSETLPQRRALRLEYLDPKDLKANPSNWKKHPPAQMRALRKAIRQTGWAGTLLYNERTKRLIDGHPRKELFEGHGKVPVLVGSWSEREEKGILALLDPLGGMGEVDHGALDELLREVGAGGNGAV
jgi:hypothetical protein